MNWYDKPVVVVDIETSGLNEFQNQIVQLSAIKVLVDPAEDYVQFNQFVKLDGPMDIEAWRVHRIPHTILQNAPSIDKAMYAFDSFVKQHYCRDDNEPILAGHHVSFDNKFLRAAYEKCSIYPFPFDRHMIDLWPIARTYLNATGVTLERYSLQSLCDYCGLIRQTGHDSFEDVSLTLILLRRFMRAIGEGVDPRNDA